MQTPWIKATILSLLAVILSGCSFSRDWRSSLKQPIPPSDISGPWEGTWVSDVSGHDGRLRCLITKKSDAEYDARFQAKYKKILTFSYSVPLQARRTGNSWRFDGEADLGKLAGGLYTYSGAATPTNFFSTYDSKHDHGKFELTRPSDK